MTGRNRIYGTRERYERNTYLRIYTWILSMTNLFINIIILTDINRFRWRIIADRVFTLVSVYKLTYKYESLVALQHIEDQCLLTDCRPPLHLLADRDDRSSSQFRGDVWSAQRSYCTRKINTFKYHVSCTDAKNWIEWDDGGKIGNKNNFFNR